MEFLKTKRAGALVLAMSVVFGTLYGSHRSLTTVASKITAQNEMVLKDLQTRVGVAENLYTVAKRYLSHEELAALRSDLDFLAASGNDVMAYADLTSAAQGVLFQMAEVDEVTEPDRKYLSGFSAQLESGVSTIARDPYTTLAEEFNTVVLQRFPANVLHDLTGVEELPVYQ